MKIKQKRSKSAPARLEADCPCINELVGNEEIEEYIEANKNLKKAIENFIEEHNDRNKSTKKNLKGKRSIEEDEDNSTKKKLKSRSPRDIDNEDEEDEDEEREFSKNNNSARKSNKPQYSSKKDESWKHQRADVGYSLKKYKMRPNIPSINLAENSVSLDRSLDKNINGNNEDKSVKENNDLSANHKYKYRIDQKEAVKFRQDLEKYRQIYA